MLLLTKNKLCSACQAGKQFTSSHPMKAYLSTSRSFGPTTYKSLGGNLYCLVIVDDYSRYTWTFFLEDKSKTMRIFKAFVKQAQNEFGSSVVKVRSDNGTEFRNTQVEELCNDMGIKHEFSSTYTPQQNGVVERKNKTLITLARAMLDDYGISQRFWAEASTPHAMHPTEFIFTASWERHPMSFSLGGSPTSPTSGCLVASATSSRKGST